MPDSKVHGFATLIVPRDENVKHVCRYMCLYLLLSPLHVSDFAETDFAHARDIRVKW